MKLQGWTCPKTAKLPRVDLVRSTENWQQVYCGGQGAWRDEGGREEQSCSERWSHVQKHYFIQSLPHSSPAVDHDGIHCPRTARGRRLAVVFLQQLSNLQTESSSLLHQLHCHTLACPCGALQHCFVHLTKLTLTQLG